jgi:hypothetical protein
MFQVKTRKVLGAVATTAVLTALASVAAPAPAVAAGAPDRFTVDISETFIDESASQSCGTQVVVTVTGSTEISLWRNEKGLVVRELDRSPGAFITWSAPETGMSTKTRADMVSHWDYGTGAVLGGPVTFVFQGLFFHLPGASSAFAWREVSVGDVDGFEDGVPIVNDGTLVSFVGHIPEEFDFTESLCSLLT